MVATTGAFPLLGLAYTPYSSFPIRLTVLIMVTVWLITFAAVLILSIKPLCVKNRLIMTAAFYFSWVFQSSLFAIVYFTFNYEFSAYLPIFAVPLVIIPAIFCTHESILINRNKPAYSFKAKTGRIAVGLSASVGIGAILGKHFVKKLDGLLLLWLVVIGFFMINYLICCEFPLNLMRLYYLTKLEKQGLVTEESFSFDEEQSNAK